MGKIICFIYDRMADFEVTFANTLLAQNTKDEIITASYDKKTVKGASGMTYLPDTSVEEALNFQDINALIIPGGWNDEQREELTKLINKLHGEKKLLGAICAGPQYLARAGVLKGYSYTTTLSEKAFDEKGISDPFPRESFLVKNVVRDRNIITAVGNAFVDFAVEICDWFNLFESPEEKETFLGSYK